MNGKTAVVTGASRGIGAAVAREFADAGAHVVVCARNDTESLGDVAAAVREAGGDVTVHRADVRDEFDVERLMETAARVGAIDALVPCAAVYHGSPGETPLAASSYAAFDDTLRTNARGVFAAVREAVPHLAADARVLVPSGSVAREARAGYGAYAVSKAAAEALARQFAAELEQVVGVVDPGAVATELAGEGGEGGEGGRDPSEVAPLFRWAATDAPAADLDGGVLDRNDWESATD